MRGVVEAGRRQEQPAGARSRVLWVGADERRADPLRQPSKVRLS